MKGKKIAAIAVTSLAFGGVVMGTVGCSDNGLQDKIDVVTDDYKAADEQVRQEARREILEAVERSSTNLLEKIETAQYELEQQLASGDAQNSAKIAELLGQIEELKAQVVANDNAIIEAVSNYLEDAYYTWEETETYVQYYIEQVYEDFAEALRYLEAEIDSTWEDFNGEHMQELKAQAVSILEKMYDQTGDELELLAEAAIDAGMDEDHVIETTNNVFKKLYRDARYVKEEGKTLVILAVDAEAVFEVTDEYVLRMDNFLNEFRLEVRKFMATEDVKDLDLKITPEEATESTARIAEFNSLINDVTYEPAAGLTGAQESEYYQGLIDNIGVTVYAAKTYEAICDLYDCADGVVDALASYSNLSGTQATYYDTMARNVLTDFDAYMEMVDLEPVSATTTTKDDVDDAFDAFSAATGLAVKRAYSYNSILGTAGDVDETITDALEGKADDELDTYRNMIGSAVGFGDWTTETDEADSEGIDTAKTAVEDELEALRLSALTYIDIKDHATDIIDDIKELENLDAHDLVDVFTDAIEAEFNFTDYLDDVKDFGTTQLTYTEYATSKKEALTNIASMAADEDAMWGIYDASVSAIEAVNEPVQEVEHLDPLTEDEENYFKNVLMVSGLENSSIDGLATQGTLSIKEGATSTTSAAALLAFTADSEAIVAGAEKLQAIKDLVVETNKTIDEAYEEAMANFIEKNTCGQDSTNAIAVVDEHKTTNDAIVANGKFTYELPTLPTATSEYESTMTAFAEFVTLLDEVTVTTTVTDIQTALDTELATMQSEYAVKEAELLATLKQQYKVALKQAYDAAVEEAGTNANKLAALEQAYTETLGYIDSTLQSCHVKGIYDACVQLFHDILGQQQEIQND